MALTKVTGHVVLPTTNIEFHNTKSTGIVTFTHTSNATSSTTGALQITGGVGIVKDLHVGGNITVGGTLTYDDVTNIDSLGIITARTDIHLGQSLIHLGDPDTKITFDTNTIKFDTNGHDRIHIKSNGNIGIGTDNPSAKIEIAPKNDGAPYLRVKNHTSAGAYTGNYGSEFRHTFNSTNHAMLIHTQEAADARRTLDISDSNGIFATFTNGKVGIGTLIPKTRLHVSDGYLSSTNAFDSNIVLAISKNTTSGSYAGLAINSGSGAKSFIHFGDTDDSNVGRMDYDHSTNGFTFYTNGQNLPRLFIASNGRVGVSEETPDSQLHISGNADAITTAGAGTNTAIRITDTDTSAQSGQVYGELQFETRDVSSPGVAAYLTAQGNSNGQASMMFGTGIGGSASTKMVLHHTGNASLGTEVPNEYANQTTFTINGNNYGRLDLEVSGTLKGSLWANSGGLGLDAGGNDIEMFTGSQQRVKINTSGQMGIGQAFSPSRQLDVKDSTGANRIMNIRGTGTSGAYLAFLDANTTDDASCRVGTKGGNKLSLRGDEHHFESGVGTSRMAITSNGTVNIGAASPTASENGQLNVYITTSSGKAQIVHSAGTGGLRLAGTGGGSGSNLIFSNNYSSGTFSDHWCISHDGGDDYLKFKSGGTGGSQRIVVKDAGEINVYRDGNGDVFEYWRVSQSLFVVDNLSNESNTRMRIRNPNGQINYNSSSDYRLKENDITITDGITRIKKLRPIQFNWKSGTNIYDGFFAHEVSEACPMAVDGTKDQVATADDVSKGYAYNV